jgi:hypothetical protein
MYKFLHTRVDPRRIINFKYLSDLYSLMDKYIDTYGCVHIHSFVFDHSISVLFSEVRPGGRALDNYTYFSIKGTSVAESAKTICGLYTNRQSSDEYTTSRLNYTGYLDLQGPPRTGNMYVMRICKNAH